MTTTTTTTTTATLSLSPHSSRGGSQTTLGQYIYLWVQNDRTTTTKLYIPIVVRRDLGYVHVYTNTIRTLVPRITVHGLKESGYESIVIDIFVFRRVEAHKVRVIATKSLCCNTNTNTQETAVLEKKDNPKREIRIAVVLHCWNNDKKDDQAKAAAAASEKKNHEPPINKLERNTHKRMVERNKRGKAPSSVQQQQQPRGGVDHNKSSLRSSRLMNEPSKEDTSKPVVSSSSATTTMASTTTTTRRPPLPSSQYASNKRKGTTTTAPSAAASTTTTALPTTTATTTTSATTEQSQRQVIAVSASKGPAAFFNLARKFLVTDEMCDLSALEGAIVAAVDAAHLLERSQLASIVK